MDTPLVSVCSMVYNHAPFLRDFFEGVLMQKTSYPFEIVVHDDASTDDSVKIIREYESRYPDIIKPIFQTENKLSKGIPIMTYLLCDVRGKYIAYCDGDDYWIDPLKLQKQIDFLETHPDYSICGGNYRWQIVGEDSFHDGEKMLQYPRGKTVTLDDFFDSYLFKTSTVCFRKECAYNMAKYKLSFDDVLYCVSLEKGKGFIFPEPFTVYRLHPGSVNAHKNRRQRLQFSDTFNREMLPDFGYRSKSLRKRYIRDTIDLRFIDLSESKHFCRDYLKMVQFSFSGKLDTLFYSLAQLIEKTGRYASARVKKFLRIKTNNHQ